MKLADGAERAPVELFWKAIIEDWPSINVGNTNALRWPYVAKFFDHVFKLMKDILLRSLRAEMPVVCNTGSTDPLHDDIHTAFIFEGGVHFRNRDRGVKSHKVYLLQRALSAVTTLYIFVVR